MGILVGTADGAHEGDDEGSDEGIVVGETVRADGNDIGDCEGSINDELSV